MKGGDKFTRILIFMVSNRYNKIYKLKQSLETKKFKKNGSVYLALRSIHWR